MKKVIASSETGRFLYDNGINYSGYGELKHGKKVYGYFFKAPSLTREQVRFLSEHCSNVELLTSRAQYAPEITSAVIVFKSQAQIAREKTKAG